MIFATIAACLLVVLALTGCDRHESDGADATADGARLLVVATTSIVGDVVSHVVGQYADVVSILPRGTNPHAYEPTPTDLRTLSDADAVFVNGLGLEDEFLSDLPDLIDGTIIDLSDGIDALPAAHDPVHDNGSMDPHVWMDPRNVIIWVDQIAEAARALGLPDVDARAAAYTAELENLDGAVARKLDTIPAERRVLVLDHNTLAYFARRYGFSIDESVVAGASDQAEPSSRDVAELVNRLRGSAVKTIFVGETSSRSLLELIGRIADEVPGARVIELLSGSLAAEGQPGDSYIDFMLLNADRVVEGLGE